MKKKILYICNDAQLGGASQSLRDSLLEIRNLVDVFVIVPEKGPLEDFFIGESIPYEVIPFQLDYTLTNAINQKDADRTFVSNWHAADKICGVIRREDISLVHINSSVSNAGAFAAMQCSIPYIYHIRELLPEQFDCDFYDWETKRKVLENADGVVSISDYVRNTFLQKYGLDSIRIYNGLAISKYYSKVKRKWSDARFLVSGNVTREKGQRIAVQAFRILTEKGYPDIAMDIVGRGGRELFRLREYIRIFGLENRVFLRGFQKDQSEYRRTCDYALTVSRKEALGRVTIEAMLAGQFVIGADEGGTKEIIGEHEERGLLFAHGNPESLTVKMEQAIRMTASEKEKIIRTAQEYALHTFSDENYAVSVSKLYDRVCREYDANKKTKLLQWLKRKYAAVNQKSDSEIAISKASSKSDGPNYGKEIRDWLSDTEGKRQLSDYFSRNGIKNVAIYGLGAMGMFLYEVFASENIPVIQMADASSDDFDRQIGIRNMIDDSLTADLLIISVLKEQETLVRDFQRQCNMNTMGIIDLYKMVTDTKENN